jgi:hypothetical protein
MDIAAAVGAERLREIMTQLVTRAPAVVARTDGVEPARDMWLLRLRAMLAGARGDAEAYGHFRDRYRDLAKAYEFDGHIAWAEALK